MSPDWCIMYLRLAAKPDWWTDPLFFQVLWHMEAYALEMCPEKEGKTMINIRAIHLSIYLEYEPQTYYKIFQKQMSASFAHH